MLGFWFACFVILISIFGLLIFFVSGNSVEDTNLVDLLEEWDLQDHLEELAEEEELEEEQDAQDLMDFLFIDEEDEE